MAAGEAQGDEGVRPRADIFAETGEALSFPVSSFSSQPYLT